MGSMDFSNVGSAGSSTSTIKNQIAAAIGDMVESTVKALLGNFGS